MNALYNEIEPFAIAWLGGLIDGGHIAHGRVDGRSIADLEPEDIGPGQAHFFAGIGGWSHALRLAGVADGFPVWTGSCPCQPFSSAGQGKGFADDRHLWPEWFRLIRQCRPPVIFGEQVASPAGLAWLDAVSADLEGEGYAIGAADLCAAGVGAPHIRQRLYFVAVADADEQGFYRLGKTRLCERWAGASSQEPAQGGSNGSLWNDIDGRGSDDIVAYAERERGRSWSAGIKDATDARSPGEADFWSRGEWVQCSDGKARLVEPGIFPLASSVPNRVGTLRGAGNAIVPPLAAAFVKAAMELIH